MGVVEKSNINFIDSLLDLLKYGENIGEGAVISYSFINQVGVGLKSSYK